MMVERGEGERAKGKVSYGIPSEWEGRKENKTVGQKHGFSFLVLPFHWFPAIPPFRLLFLLGVHGFV
ncbi:hypothetical protein I3843_05G218500 [Carya illinoinensis]|nr:hypothetical protein I3843_05G218500 [Carya illinoinensis]